VTERDGHPEPNDGGQRRSAVTSGRRVLSLVAVAAAIAVAAVAFLLLAPVKATYIDEVGSDTIDYRTASCGAPVAALLGADPLLYDGGGSVHRLGPQGPRAACDAAAGKRVSGGLLLLLIVATTAWVVEVKTKKHATMKTSSPI
jgi:hypothetical protein